MLPNLVIAGVPKAATSTLFRWLADHPQVAGSRVKETYYFVDPGTHMFQADANIATTGLVPYEAFFEDCDPDARIVLEATPSYIYSEAALDRLTSLPTQPLFLFMLREPASQLRSLFTYFQQNWNWISRQMSFRQFIDMVRSGNATFRGNELAQNALDFAWYSKHLRRWQEKVGSERMLVFLVDDMKRDQRGFMMHLAVHLGIDPKFYEHYDFPSENVTYVARFGALQDANIWLRRRLPQGRSYDAMRQLYRQLNTRAPSRGKVHRDPALELELATHFAPMLTELETEFGMDVSAWRRDVVADRHKVGA